MSSVLRKEVLTDGDDGIVYIEVEDAPPVRELAQHGQYGGTRGASGAADSLTAGMGLIRQCATAVVSSVSQIAASARPSEVEVTFGIKFASEVGAFIAKSGLDASLNVKLKWVEKKKDE